MNVCTNFFPRLRPQSVGKLALIVDEGVTHSLRFANVCNTGNHR